MEKSSGFTSVRLTKEQHKALISFKGQIEKERGQLVSLGEALLEAIRRAGK